MICISTAQALFYGSLLVLGLLGTHMLAFTIGEVAAAKEKSHDG